MRPTAQTTECASTASTRSIATVQLDLMALFARTVNLQFTSQLSSSSSQVFFNYVCSFFYSDINECSPNPCQNGGICTDAINDYICTCPFVYFGTNCERRKFKLLILNFNLHVST